MRATGHTLVLVPTEIERRHLARHPNFDAAACCELCGFGPVAAAARTASLIAAQKPARVILAGIAGTYDRQRLPVGAAAVFGRVVMYGIGVGTGSRFVPAGAMGFPQWPGNGDDDRTIDDELGLSIPVPAAAGPLLTCCAASVSADEARRRTQFHPGVLAEDMEGFGVAVACRLAAVPLAITRGISNLAGNRSTSRWQVPEAMDAVWPIVNDLVTRPAWDDLR